MLRGEKICKYYTDRSSGKKVAALADCSLAIGSGEAVGLMGGSGSGKSTLARILLRLIPCDSGRILFEEQEITHLRNRDLLCFRRRVQLISQRPESFFDPLMTLAESLREPLEIYDLPYCREEIGEVLELVKLNISLLQRYPHQVSGGEIQRLSIARALLLQPQILILDEPTSMLDISVQAQILQLLKQIRRDRQLSYLLISHDAAVVRWMCDRTLLLRDGRL